MLLEQDTFLDKLSGREQDVVFMVVDKASLVALERLVERTRSVDGHTDLSRKLAGQLSRKGLAREFDLTSREAKRVRRGIEDVFAVRAGMDAIERSYYV